MIYIIQNTRDNAKLDAILARPSDFSAEREATVREIVATAKERGEKHKRGWEVNLCRRACQTTARTELQPLQIAQSPRSQGLLVESFPLIQQGDYRHRVAKG